jgi:hypothetical protein
MQITPMFAVPFCFTELPQPEALNGRLCELFLAREAEGKRYANPLPFTERNASVFESRFDLFSWPDPDIQQLRDFCLSNLLRVVGQLSGFDEKTQRSLLVKTDAWFHVTRRNGYFGVHNHPLASWSGVYCVAPGIDDAEEPDSGKLTFITPHLASGMYVDVASGHLKPPFGVHNFGLQMKAGQLVLFPSSQLHQVLPFYGEGERITVAFNCAFGQREG